MGGGLDVLLASAVAFQLLRGAVGDCPADRFCPDDFCITGSCRCSNATVNDTFLEGDRPFTRGQSCNISSLMCDGSTTFYCDNGECQEKVQGEVYTCKCADGYAGTHCELKGELCPDGYYCYNTAKCKSGSSTLCDCPGEWQGDAFCSVKTGGADSEGSTGTDDNSNQSDSQKWYVPLLSVIAGLAVLVFLGVVGLRFYKRRHVEAHRFEEVQMHGGPTFYDDDDDAFSTRPLQRR